MGKKGIIFKFHFMVFPTSFKEFPQGHITLFPYPPTADMTQWAELTLPELLCMCKCVTMTTANRRLQRRFGMPKVYLG